MRSADSAAYVYINPSLFLALICLFSPPFECFLRLPPAVLSSFSGGERVDRWARELAVHNLVESRIIMREKGVTARRRNEKTSMPIAESHVVSFSHH